MGKLRSILSRRGAKAEPKALPLTPTGYRTFSQKLAPSLTAAGGVLSVLGGLGAWIRVSQETVAGLPQEEVNVVMGHIADWGRVIAALGAIATVGSIAWLMRRLVPKLATIAVSLGIVGLAAWRLPIIDRQASALARAALSGTIDFISFHAGFGWGAWCLVAGAVSLSLGVVVGVLRELDLRRGVPQ